MTSRTKGIICIVLSAFFFAWMSVFIKMAGDLPSTQKAFFRNAVAAVFAAGFLLYKHKFGKEHKSKSEIRDLRKKALLPLILRAVAGTVGIICNFYAVDHLVLSDASMLNKMSPFFAVIFSLFILKEEFKIQQGLAVLVAFLGSLFILKPSFDNIEFLPALIGLLGGMGAGIAYTFVRKLGTMGVAGPFIVVFFSLFSCLCLSPFLIFDYAPMTSHQFLMLLMTGVAAAGGQFSITAAYFHAPAKEISVYDYSNIIFSALFGFILFNQVPDLWSVLGYVIICSMGVWMFFYNKKK